MKIQFESELKKVKKISGTNGLNTSIVNTEGNEPYSTLASNTLKGGK